jgi:hypothetical protein
MPYGVETQSRRKHDARDISKAQPWASLSDHVTHAKAQSSRARRERRKLVRKSGSRSPG